MPDTLHADTRTVTLPVEGMTCASCVGRVEKALAAVPGVAGAAVNLAAERAEVRLDRPVTRADLIAAVEKAGYDVLPAQVELAVEGMTCASCVGRVEKALKAVPGVTGAAVNLATERASVSGTADVAELVAAVEAAGYAARLAAAPGAAEGVEARREAEAGALRGDVILAAALSLPVFVLEMGSHLVPAFHHLVMQTIGQQASWLIQFALTLTVLAGPGRRFFLKGLPALAKAAPDMNSLVAVGTAAAFGYSLVATFAPALLPEGSRAVYYEAAAVIVTLVLLGRLMEARAKGRTSQA
ncbi:MAG: copper ion binding protein, partial [Rhodobacteraceae bacterium]|nr:copper ion binding protein [Paracoccaceae bacterium]